jgi:iron complex transport system permease protein
MSGRSFMPAKILVPMLLVATGVLLIVALCVGSATIPPARIGAILWEALRQPSAADADARIILTIRLPRIFLALVVGSGMGLAGLASQTLFRNPLASPYVLGVSNGAAVGAVVAMLWVGKTLTYASVPMLSLAGGLTVGVMVFSLARRSDHFGHTLLLAGIAISAFCSALTAAALYLAGERLQTVVFWLMGGLWQATWRDVLLVLPISALALLTLIVLAPAMNVALAGERAATDLGLPVRRFQTLLLLLICVTTAVAVAVSGVIGFVGLIVPHLLRLFLGADHRALVPASALGGALLLLAADTLARTLAAPAEIPVGIITALIGAPVFLWFLRRRVLRGAVA